MISFVDLSVLWWDREISTFKIFDATTNTGDELNSICVVHHWKFKDPVWPVFIHDVIIIIVIVIVIITISIW